MGHGRSIRIMLWLWPLVVPFRASVGCEDKHLICYDVLCICFANALVDISPFIQGKKELLRVTTYTLPIHGTKCSAHNSIGGCLEVCLQLQHVVPHQFYVNGIGGVKALVENHFKSVEKKAD